VVARGVFGKKGAYEGGVSKECFPDNDGMSRQRVSKDLRFF